MCFTCSKTKFIHKEKLKQTQFEIKLKQITPTVYHTGDIRYIENNYFVCLRNTVLLLFIFIIS